MGNIEKHEALCPADVGLGECCCMFKAYNAWEPPMTALTVPSTVTEEQADVLGVPVSVYERIVRRAANFALQSLDREGAKGIDYTGSSQPCSGEVQAGTVAVQSTGERRPDKSEDVASSAAAQCNESPDYDAGLERAAQVAYETATKYGWSESSSSSIAFAIRALKGQKK